MISAFPAMWERCDRRIARHRGSSGVDGLPSNPVESSAFDANIVFETMQEDAMVDCVKSSIEGKQHQQGACIAVHGKEIIYHSNHSSQWSKL